MDDKNITLVDAWSKICEAVKQIDIDEQEETALLNINQKEILDAIKLDKKFDAISISWDGEKLYIVLDPMDTDFGRTYKTYKNYKKQLDMDVVVYGLYTDFNQEIFDNASCVLQNDKKKYLVRDDIRVFSIEQIMDIDFEGYLDCVKKNINSEQIEIVNGLEWQDGFIYFQDRKYFLLAGIFEIDEEQPKMIGYKMIFESKEERIFECIYVGLGNYSDIIFEAKDIFANLIDFN